MVARTPLRLFIVPLKEGLVEVLADAVTVNAGARTRRVVGPDTTARSWGLTG